MRKLLYIITGFVSVMTLSCNDYLDQMPDDRTVIDSKEKVKDLLVSAYPNTSFIEFCEPMSDNARRKKMALMETKPNEQAYFWQDITQRNQGTPFRYWESCYRAISAANHALEVIEHAPDAAEYSAYKGEALLSRAYHHFMLVSLFSQQYSPQTAEQDLGIPYVTVPEKVVQGNYERHTVKYVFDMIKKDLEAGLALIDNDAYEVPKYHFTESAAYAFASRYYLTIGDWENVVLAANRVLGVNPENQLRDWAAYDKLTPDDFNAIYTKSTENANILMSSTVSVLGLFDGRYRYGLEAQIVKELYNATNVTGGEWLYKMYGSGGLLTTGKYKKHFKLNGLNANTGIPHIMSPLFTMEEVLFNRAEALIMLGEDRFEEVIKDVNVFLSKRIEEYDPGLHGVTLDEFMNFYNIGSNIAPWFEISKDQRILLNGVLDLKQREFMQEGMRWFDIKRFNMEIRRMDDEGYVIDILRPRDPRKAIQIPEVAVAAGLEANPR